MPKKIGIRLNNHMLMELQKDDLLEKAFFAGRWVYRLMSHPVIVDDNVEDYEYFNYEDPLELYR